MIALLAGTMLAASPCNAAWPLWQRYVETFIAGDGRVIDRTASDRSTSEGQAYALFFSLVANDRALFQRVLRWTEQNLAQGDLRTTLPAWHWGKRRDGSWGVRMTGQSSWTRLRAVPDEKAVKQVGSGFTQGEVA